MNSITFIPSFYAHIINGIFLLLAFIFLFQHYSSLSKQTPYNMISLLLLLSISVGVHGLSHSNLERNYNYNPMDMILS